MFFSGSFTPILTRYDWMSRVLGMRYSFCCFLFRSSFVSFEVKTLIYEAQERPNGCLLLLGCTGLFFSRLVQYKIFLFLTTCFL